MRSLALASLIILVPPLSSPALADAQRGQKLAQEKCGTCHNVGKRGASPNLKAPTFRRIAHQWAPELLQESLAEGIVTGHNDMPEFTFSPRQIDDLVDHLTKLRQPR